MFSLRSLPVVAVLSCVWSSPAVALERLCDPSYQDCRSPLLTLIANEKVGIEVAFWFMEDARYTTALIGRFRAGVPVRVIIDPRANTTYTYNAARLKELADAGIPMRKRVSGGILHWKAMIFVGQGTVQFGGANYSPWAFTPVDPYRNYTDEVIHFTEKVSVVNSFLTKFDVLWTNTTSYANYANVTSLVAMHAVFPMDPDLNFVPGQDFGARSVQRYNAEGSRIDVLMYRITDRRHTDAIIAARNRGIPVRLITEPQSYRDRKYLWHSWNVDRLYMAGVQIKHRSHAGLNHQKLVLLYGQGMSIYGSSNWTSASATSQEEHNYFSRDANAFTFFRQQFLRKWNNSTGIIENVAFVPLPPDTPAYVGPATTSKQATTGVRLAWKPGPWAHSADIYFGTSSTPPLYKANVAVTPNTTVYFTLPQLSAGRTYYWRIVSKTMANKTKSGAVWYFGT